MTETAIPRILIEDWLPVTELGIESRRERAFVAAIPDLFSLHVWWARRPLVASAGVILASLLPPWSQELADAFPDEIRVDSEAHYKRWFLHLCGIWGDPVAGKAILDRANAEGRKIHGNGYGYKQAYKNSPNPADLDLLHRILERSWGSLPNVIDPTAGGGSIPYEAIRYGLPAHANDLNQVAAVTLRAGVETAAKYGPDLADDLDKWGHILIGRLAERLRPFFLRANEAEKIVGYLHARSVACPRTGKPVPLAPNWWISRAKGSECAAQVVTERAGISREEPAFEIVWRANAFAAKPDKGTVARGDGLSPWDGLVIDGDYIKTEAQSGRMGSILYAVAIRLPETQASGKVKWVRSFRAPTQADHDAIRKAETALEDVLRGWLATGIVPSEDRFIGFSDRSANYGILRWVDMFSPRQLLVHGTFVEEHHRIASEIQAEVGGTKAAALVGLLGLMTSKALNYNSVLASWHTKDAIIRPVFDRHDFSFKWSFSEFEGAEALWAWAHERNVVNTRAVAQTLVPGSGAWVLAGRTIKGERSDLRHPVPAPATVTQGSGGSLGGVPDGSQTLVCIDPPYYDNVMYGELSDFFGVWEQHTVGKVWPDLMLGGVADLKNEAVANPARFKEFGRRRNELATADYEAKMHAIFAECDRVLRPDGVMSVMFTHKRSEAWDTLGMALLQAGFSIETSWPVNTESEQSLHQAKKNSAASTIMLVCRKRSVAADSGKTFFEDIEADVRAAARQAAKRFEAAGIDGVDLLLATYGPALSVLSRAWPVYSSETDEDGRSRLLRPEEALGAAREEVVRLRKAELVGRDVAFDGITDFVLIAWQTFRAEEFPYDEARRLALAIGGGDVEALAAAKALDKKAGMVRLLSPKERKRKVYRPVLDGEVAGLPLVDVLHAVLIEASESSLGAAKALCDRLRLLEDQRFIDLIQAMVRAIPNTRLKGKWVRSEAEILHQFCTAYLPQVELPENPASDALFELD